VDSAANVQAARSAEAILRAVERDAIIVSTQLHWSEYFWYYLIARKWGERNIYVMHHYAAADLQAYLERGTALRLRSNAGMFRGPGDLLLWEGHAAELERAGLMWNR